MALSPRMPCQWIETGRSSLLTSWTVQLLPLPVLQDGAGRRAVEAENVRLAARSDYGLAGARLDDPRLGAPRRVRKRQHGGGDAGQEGATGGRCHGDRSFGGAVRGFRMAQGSAARNCSARRGRRSPCGSLLLPFTGEGGPRVSEGRMRPRRLSPAFLQIAAQRWLSRKIERRLLAFVPKLRLAGCRTVPYSAPRRRRPPVAARPTCPAR